jgi:hypothetical protein
VSADINPDRPAQSAISPAALAAAAVAVVALLGFVGYQTLAPKVYPPPMPTNVKPDPSIAAFKTWAQQRYRETGGDWSKLPPEDQQRFVNASRGKGKSMFESYKP